MQLSNYLSLPARFRQLKPKQKRFVRLGCAALALTLSMGAVSFLTTRAADDVVTKSDVNVVTNSDAETSAKNSMFFSRSAEPKLTRSSIVEEGSCGDNATYTIDSSGLLTVSGSGAINREAFNNKTNITAVSFGSGITTVNAFAFKGCTGLTSVTFPSSITTIQMAAFYGCSGLQSVTFNGNVTAMGNSAFVQCNNLNALTIEGMSFEGAEFQYLQTGTVVTLTKGFTFDGIEVTQDNAESYFGNATVNFRVPVTGVTLNKNSMTLPIGSSETLTATILPEDATNQNVTWSSSNTNVAAVDQNGNVTAVDRGTATITATTADGGFTASCQVTVAVPVTGVKLNKDELKLHTGKSETLTATLVPQNANNQNVTWSSSDPSVATVDQSGKVTAAGVGTASVTVTTEEGSFTASCQVTVVVPVTGVTLDKSELRLLKSESATLTATVEPEDATDRKLTWSSSNTNVANVDQSGKVTAKNAGSATITATTEDGAFTAACEVSVKESTYIVQSESVLDWTKGSGKDMTVVIKNAENDEETHLKFTALYVDNVAEAVAPSNYETAKGSLRLTLKASYLETLSVGKHALTVEFKDGSVKQSFTVHAASVGSNSPGTGESSFFLMLCVILLAVSGACGAFVVIRRKISRA